MSRLRKVTIAIADYRTSQISPVRGIPLGVFAGARVGNECGVSICSPELLSDEQLVSMDGIAREMLLKPIAYFQPLLEKHLRNGKTPDDIFRDLSDANNSALCVAEPRELAVDIRLDKGASIADVVAHVGMHVLQALMNGQDPMSLRITGHSGTLAQAARSIEPHIANWANEQARPQQARPGARVG